MSLHPSSRVNICFSFPPQENGPISMSAWPKPSLKPPLGQPHPAQLQHSRGRGGELKERLPSEQGWGQEAYVLSLPLSVPHCVSSGQSLLTLLSFGFLTGKMCCCSQMEGLRRSGNQGSSLGIKPNRVWLLELAYVREMVGPKPPVLSTHTLSYLIELWLGRCAGRV